MTTTEAEALRATYLRVARSINVEIPAHLAENAGWEQMAMPAMLGELGLAEAPALAWFVNGTSDLYDKGHPDQWRYCQDPGDTTVLDGIAYGGEPPRVYLRADMSLARTIETLGHELWHLHEFATGKEPDEHAARNYGAQAAARFWAAQYR